MPSKCFVPGCRTNYNASSKFRIFSFPRDEDLKKLWLKAINRQDKREPGKSSKVCERHFTSEDIIKEALFYDSKSRENIRIQLQKHRLQQKAVPSLFDNLQYTRNRRRLRNSSSLDEIPVVDQSNQDIAKETDFSHNIAKMRACCVPGCKSNYKKPYVSVFLFPKSPAFRDLWLKKIGRPLMDIKEYTSVCIKHFEKQYIINKGGFAKRIGIKPGAVPTIFQNEDDHNLSDDLDNSEDIIDNMKSKDIGSVSASDASDDEFPGSPPSEQADLTATTNRPFIEVVKPDNFESEEPLTTEEVFDDISPVKSSPISKPNSTSKSISGNRSKNTLPSPYKHLPSVSVCLKDEDRITVQKELSKSNKRSLSTCSNSSIGSSETPRLQPKRRKIEKPAPTVIGKQNDCYCWVCHRENVVLSCIACPRAYHPKCAGENGNLPDWVCPECKRVLTAENVDSRSSVLSEISLDKLCTLLRFSLNKMKHRAGVAFLQPVSLEHYPMYLHYVIHPMDFSLLEKNIKQKLYGCTEAFLSDVKWILHNSCVFNGSQHPLSTNAKSMVKACDNDMQEIEVCPDCFMHNIVRNKYWFSEVCQKPHPLVWAKLKGFPYWPAKVVRIADGNVDARFFGAHDRAWVPMSQCYHLSKEMPTSSKPKKKGNYETALDELNVHVQLLIQKYGSFEYAPYRTVFDPENKHLTFHGINTDLAAKKEVQSDKASSEGTILNETGAGTSTSKRFDDSKDTEQTKLSTDPTSNVTPSNMPSLSEKESRNLSEKESQLETGQSSLSKPLPLRSDPVHRNKMDLVLQRITGYVTNDIDEDSEEEGNLDKNTEKGSIEKNTEKGDIGKNTEKGDIEKNTEKGDVVKDSDKSDIEKDSNKGDIEKDSSKLNEKRESERKENTLSGVLDSKDDESNDQEDKEENICLSDLIKSRLLPTPSDSLPMEECPEKETPPILDTAKKNDSFSLKLIETIASCKAKLGISGDLDKSDSDSEEEDEDEDEDEEEESENEDGERPRKVRRRRLASNDDSTEEDASDESSSESDDAESVSSNTDIEIVEEQDDAVVGKEAEKTSGDGFPDVASGESVLKTPEKEAPSKDSEANVSPVNASVSGVTSLQETLGDGSKPEVENSGNEDAPSTTLDELVSAGDNLESGDAVVSNLVSDNSDKCIPVNKVIVANLYPATRSRSVSSNALQSSTDDLTDTDMQVDGVEIQITSQKDETPVKTDTAPANQSPEKDKTEMEMMEDDDIYICPPVKPPTPPLICLDDGTETEPEPEDDGSNKNKSPKSSPRSTKLPPPDEKICPENTDKYVSILKNAKLIPQNARKSSVKRQLRTVTSEDSSDEEMEVITRHQKVPTSGAIRTFNRERSGAVTSPMGNNSRSEHQFPVQPREIASRNSSSRNRHLQKNYEESDQEEILDTAANVTISMSDLAEKDAEIMRLKKKLNCIFNAFQLQQWKSAQEKAELRHNMNLIIMEMRASLEADKKQAIDNLTRTLEKEKQRCIDETKKKQWCAFCKLESRYACCWNTSYCTVTCQKRHIAEHRHFCTQLKAKPNDVEAVKHLQTSTADPKEGKKVIVLNVLPNKDAKSSKDASQENSQQTCLTKVVTPSLHLVSTPNSQSNSTVQYVLASLRPGSTPTAASQKPTTSKADNSDAESNTDSEDLASTSTKNTDKKEELTLEEIYFPSPPTICFEGLDTALPDENVHFEDLEEASEDHASDNELTIAEESSAEEDMVLSDNDEADNEMVSIGRGVDVKAKYLNKCLIYGKDAKKLTRCLVDVIFSDTLLSMCSAFGNKSNVTKLTRAALPFKKVEAIIDYVLKRFPSSTRSEITLAINMKCKEARLSVVRVESSGKSKKTFFRRLLAKEQQQDAKVQKQGTKSKSDTKEQHQGTKSKSDTKEQQQGTKSKSDTKEHTQNTKDSNSKTTPVPEVTKSNPPKPPTTVTLIKNPLPGVVRLQSPSSSGTTTTSCKAPAKPNILRMGRQILIRPKYSLATPGGPNRVMLSAPTTGQYRARAPTVRTLLNMQQPLASLSKDKSKLIFPVKMIQKAVVGNPSGSPEVGNASASQRPYIIVGSSQRPIAPATQKPPCTIAPKK